MTIRKRVTMQDIAEKAGVTKMTVSRVFRNDPVIPSGTSRRIRKIAMDLHYSPDPILSALAVYRAGIRPPEFHSTIAYLNCWEPQKAWRKSRFFVHQYEGLCETAQALGYRVEEFWIHAPGMTTKRLSKILQSRGIRGILIGPFSTAGVHLKLAWENFAVVALGYSLAQPRIHRVSNHHYESIVLALRQCVAHGFSRIGLAVTHGENRRVNQQWSSGYFNETNGNNRCVKLPIYGFESWDQKSFETWHAYAKPEVVVSSNRIVLEWMERIHIHVPRDVGYVNLNNEVFDEVSGIYQNSKVIGEEAMKLLSGMLQRCEYGLPKVPLVVHIEGSWWEGSTLSKQYA